ncbi:hypothetical protein BU25DRAFT_162878 [Macroventuria anomochaeta]|uniref:Uncharacterized protein n=1 Tax=Macroventuria anomochaeta TaxID=301207 RepID=A0ACB6RQB9_9PLEO|nr:uncharacterized protein BU25DRAFT_162878 [Macroventuria anomochaeta]KAF2624170.1 hypothetical protein BU25DRAFT_162878 [Macroventuria anomochaeta]
MSISRCPEVIGVVRRRRSAVVKMILEESFDTYEKMLRHCSEAYSVGDCITITDVCMWPQVQMTEIYMVRVKEELNR